MPEPAKATGKEMQGLLADTRLVGTFSLDQDGNLIISLDDDFMGMLRQPDVENIVTAFKVFLEAHVASVN